METMVGEETITTTWTTKMFDLLSLQAPQVFPCLVNKRLIPRPPLPPLLLQEFVFMSSMETLASSFVLNAVDLQREEASNELGTTSNDSLVD